MDPTRGNKLALPSTSTGSGWFSTGANPRAGKWSIAFTGALLGTIELLDRTILPIPVPISISQIAAVYAAMVGGLRYGLVSAAMIAAYGVYAFSSPDQPFQYTYENIWRVCAGLIVPTIVVLVIGLMRRRGERASLAMRETAVLEAQLAERRKIEQELRRQRSEQQTIFHSVPAMIWFKDKHNRILRVNYHAARSLGKTVEEVEGRTTEDLYPHEAEKYLKDDLEVANSGESRLGIVERYEVADGKDLWVRTDKIPYRDENGNIVGVIVFAVDITEQHAAQQELQASRLQLEQRVRERTAELLEANENLRREIAERRRAEEQRNLTEHRLQQIIDNSTAVIYGKDADGRYWLINNKFEEIFHLTRDGIIGRNDYELFSQSAADAFRVNDQLVLRSGKPIEFEEVAPHHDGPHDYISLKFPLFDASGRAVATCGISTDISDRMAREKQMVEYAGKLEQANRDLAAAREAADSANQSKSRFLANISHEIRTPIMAMLGAAELLGGKNPASDRRDMILRNGRHLLALIDELLDVSRIEAGRLNIILGDCSLLDILADVDAITEPLRVNRSIDYRVYYETPVPSTIHTDRTRLTQAIVNLVNNALKFTPEGFVHVRAWIDKDETEPRLTVVVEDSGIGVRSEDRERIFETFAQVEVAARGSAGGAGLGLPLARWIAERLGGSLTLESASGNGSRFTLRVETGDLSATDWTKPEEIQPSRTPALMGDRELQRISGRVLLAEDTADTRELVQFALQGAGAEVVAATNGRQAVQFAKEMFFDLILLDIRMPELDGVAAAREIRAAGFRGAMIALTASTSGQERANILTAGFDDIWPKPISLCELIERASDFLHAEQTTAAADAGNIDSARRAEKWNSAVGHFAASLPSRLRVLEDAVAARDRTRVHDVLHQLVGAAGIHGFMDLSHEAATLMGRFQVGDPGDQRPDLTRIRTLVDEAAANRSTA